MAQTFLKKDGDIREVLRTMFQSPEFWAPDAYRAKVKTPLEFVVSAVRASGAEVNDAMPLARQLQTMGMPLYGMQPPTGYSMKADAWVNSSALLGRMNFALAPDCGKAEGSAGRFRSHVGEQQRAGRSASRRWRRWKPACWRAMFRSRRTTPSLRSWKPRSEISQRRLDDPAAPDIVVIAGSAVGIAGVSEKVDGSR